MAKFIISICGRQFELHNEPVHFVDADGYGHTLLDCMFDQTLCVQHHLDRDTQRSGLYGRLENTDKCAERVSKGEDQKAKDKGLTPSAASMKRTTPSEIRMLDVTSSEKFTWPSRETRFYITFCFDTSKPKYTFRKTKHAADTQYLVYP